METFETNKGEATKKQWVTPTVEIIAESKIESGFYNWSYEDVPPYDTFRPTPQHS